MITGDCGEIDVHNSKLRYQKAIEIYKKSNEGYGKNRQYILGFLNDCQLGKTVLHRAKKMIKPNRLLKYLYSLRQIEKHLSKDFKHVNQKEMEKFIRKVDSNSLGFYAKNGKLVPREYTEWTRHDIKITLKKFYKWLLGSNTDYPKIVSWIDTHVIEKDPPALTYDEIKTMVDYARDQMKKAMTWALFETGARASEFLNIRLRHITDKGHYFLIRIEFSKTYKRTIPIYEGQSFLREWISFHPNKIDQNAQLFPIKYSAFEKWVKRLGYKALGKRVNPHLFRHSFATWLAGKKVSRYQMCKLMGWSMSSAMPDVYIDRNGVVEEETLQSIRGDELTKAQSINSGLQKDLQELQYKFSQLTEQIEHKRNSDGFLDKLMTDKEVQRIICQKIRELGLENQLNQL